MDALFLRGSGRKDEPRWRSMPERTLYVAAAERASHLRALWAAARPPSLRSRFACDLLPRRRAGLRRSAVREDGAGMDGAVRAGDVALPRGASGYRAGEISKTMLALEMQGTILRGSFENARRESAGDEDVEWCERRLLQRIHKRTLAGLRRQIDRSRPRSYMQWLLRWQCAAPQCQMPGETGVLEALRLLQGFEAPAIEWERTLLPHRVAGYDPRWLDSLCLQGVVGWGRISPHPAFSSSEWGIFPTAACGAYKHGSVTFFVRDEAQWMDRCLAGRIARGEQPPGLLERARSGECARAWPGMAPSSLAIWCGAWPRPPRR